MNKLNMKFTKGPWSKDKYGNVLASGKTIRLIGVELCAEDDEVKANTDLVAAAPDLVYSLVVMRNFMAGMYGEDDPYVKDADNVLGKAGVISYESY